MKPVTILAGLAVLLALIGCHEREVSVPDYLVGVWSTADPRYEGRYLQFTKDSVVFQAGTDQVTVHRIKKLKETRTGQAISYKLTYRDVNGSNSKFDFTYDPANEGEIRIKNQKNITWTKNPAKSASGEEVSAG